MRAYHEDRPILRIRDSTVDINMMVRLRFIGLLEHSMIQVKPVSILIRAVMLYFSFLRSYLFIRTGFR